MGKEQQKPECFPQSLRERKKGRQEITVRINRFYSWGGEGLGQTGGRGRPSPSPPHESQQQIRTVTASLIKIAAQWSGCLLPLRFLTVCSVDAQTCLDCYFIFIFFLISALLSAHNEFAASSAQAQTPQLKISIFNLFPQIA